MEAAVVWWTCSCGIKVKAALDMSRTSVTVQWPNTACNAKRTIPGQITAWSVETEQYCGVLWIWIGLRFRLRKEARGTIDRPLEKRGCNASGQVLYESNPDLEAGHSNSRHD